MFSDRVEIYKPYEDNIYAYRLHKEHPSANNSRKVIYCAKLVKEISKALGIIYKGQSTYTVRQIEYMDGCVPILIIKKEVCNESK